MWSLDEKPLYDEIDTTSRHVKGLNLEVLANLIKFYLLKPTLREKDVENSEYLSHKKYIHNLKNNYNRNYAWRSHRHIYSKRPRHLPKPDTEMWEKIYRQRHPEQTFPVSNNYFFLLLVPCFNPILRKIFIVRFMVILGNLRF